MPVLKKIVVQDFRNIGFQEIHFSPNINCISGNNGEGKTNLLDAIYYLSMTKSPMSGLDRYNFRHGCDSFTVAGTYLMPNGLESVFSIQVNSDGSKRIKRDEKTLQRISDHVGILPIVLVSPSDTTLVSDAGEERRRFVNSVLSQLDRKYLGDMQAYNRLLQQRNRLLKEDEPDLKLMEAFDFQLSMLAEPISCRRREFVNALIPLVSQYYEELSGAKESVGIEYRTDLDKGPLEEILAATRDRDKVLRYTSAGIQRDDFIFIMDGHPIRKCGSQGQQKSFLVSLKFAQYDLMREESGIAPILLLDDMFDKLDMGRVSNLLSMVAGSDFGQIFLTDSNKVRLAGIVDALTDDRSYFETEAGVFTKVEED